MMIRDLKTLTLAMLALVALGATVSSAAQGAARFTVEGAGAADETTLTVLKDDEGGTKPKTAHHVFDFYNAAKTTELSLTCNELTADGTVVGPEQTDITLVTPAFEGGGTVFPKCTLAGQDITLENKGCNFTLQATGTFEITSETNTAGNKCAHGEKPIVFAIPNCKIEIGAQTLVNKLRYHNLAGGLITVETPTGAVGDPFLEFTYNATGATCPFGTLNNGQYTTGNTLITGEKKGTNTMVNLKWDSI
jgi:hypothetical protein